MAKLSERYASLVIFRKEENNLLLFLFDKKGKGSFKMTGYVKCNYCRKFNIYDSYAMLNGYNCEFCGKHND